MINYKQMMDFMIKTGLRESQIVFLYIILKKDYPELYRYCQEISAFKKSEIQDMVDKGYVTNTSPDDPGMYADSFEVTEKFRKLVFAERPELLFEEFWNSYPNFLFIEGKKFPTKGTNMETLEENYIKLIKENVGLHNSIIASVEWGKSRGYLTTGILKFFESQGWRQLHQEMKDTLENGELPSHQRF